MANTLGLTTLQQEVVDLLAHGKSVCEIAQQKGNTPWTIYNALYRARQTLECETTFQLMYRLGRENAV